MPLSYRASRFLFFFACHELIVAAYYFQFVAELAPCPLCIFQRIVFVFMALFFLMAALHNPRSRGKLVYDFAALIPTLIGIFIAGRHVWLQHLPKDEVPTCGPGLNYLLDTLPFGEALDHILRGSGECAEVSWTMMGFSMPELTLGVYTGFALILLYSIKQNFKTRNPW